MAGQLHVVVVSPRLSWQLSCTKKGWGSSWCRVFTELVRLVSSNFPFDLFLLARCFLPSPRSDMPQSPRTGSEVTPFSPSNHLCCRTCSHYSPSLLSGLWEGRPPSVHQCCQNRGKCLPSGSSLDVNGRVANLPAKCTTSREVLSAYL